MPPATDGFASDQGTRLLNIELRRLEKNPQDAVTSYPRIIRAMHAELMQLSSENLNIQAELDTTIKSVQELSQQLAKQEHLQVAEENNRTWAVAAASMLRTKLKMAQRNIRQKRDHNTQLRQFDAKHAGPVPYNASNGMDDA